jgi:hypothetical protein
LARCLASKNQGSVDAERSKDGWTNITPLMTCSTQDPNAEEAAANQREKASQGRMLTCIDG